jgi:hypothetical protein
MSFERDFQEPKDRYFASEDLNFQSGDSPVVLDIESSIGVKSNDCRILCKSNVGNTGNILVELSTDGSTYGTQFTVFNYETLPFNIDILALKISKIRITHTGTDSGYRVLAR